MSIYKTQVELDKKVAELKAMDNTSLITMMLHIYVAFTDSSERMLPTMDSEFEEYMMARNELESRLK